MPGITREEKRRRKKMNTVTTGFNLAVWILEVLASVIVFLPMVNSEPIGQVDHLL